MAGELAILNVGDGDSKLSFDPTKPEEVERSKQVVEDMLRRGFVILIEVGRNDNGPLYQRALGFDPETAEYIVAGAPPAEESASEETEAAAPRARKAPAQARGRKGYIKDPKRRVAAATARAVGVSRTAGG